MIDPLRQQLFDKLIELSEQAPDYRFGQMICNLAMLGRGTDASATWDIEDAELLAAAEEHLANWKRIHEAELAKTV